MSFLGVEKFPDGTVLFREASEKIVDLKLQINDMLIMEYHPANGLTKTMFRLSEEMQEENNKMNPLRRFQKDKEGSWPVGYFFTIANTCQ